MYLRRHDRDPGLIVGLVNNMPPAAFRAAESQFGHVVRAAAAEMLPGLPIHMRCFASRPPLGVACEPLESLWGARIDGLIVTGAQPASPGMADEPAWPALSRIADWAAANTGAVIWSCFAAHAVAFKLDGVVRHRLPAKLSGVYRCVRGDSHALVPGEPQHWLVPHSRYCDLDPGSLVAAGYQILSRGPGLAGLTAGADSFTKQAGRSRFLMLQGHPEYAADTLLREYRRDVRRHVAGAIVAMPRLPEGCLDAATATRLMALQGDLTSPQALLAELDAAIGAAPPPQWRPASVQLFGRWLSHLAASQHAEAFGWRRVAS